MLLNTGQNRVGWPSSIRDIKHAHDSELLATMRYSVDDYDFNVRMLGTLVTGRSIAHYDHESVRAHATEKEHSIVCRIDENRCTGAWPPPHSALHRNVSVIRLSAATSVPSLDTH